MTLQTLCRRTAISAPMPAPGASLERTLTTTQLTLLGVGCTLGTGIFFIFQTAVPKAGPAVIVSFVLASVVAALTALCYAELASSIPASGSAYSYAYATMGEMAAFAVAVLLLFEYGIAGSAVAVGWSQYVDSLLSNAFGLHLPTWATHAPSSAGFGVNLPAVVLLVLCGWLLTRGASESTRINTIMVVLNLVVLGFFALVALRGFRVENLQPFMPHGMSGITAAGGTVFFTFVGLNAICTAGEEVQNPQKSLPRAMVAALLIVTTLYVVVAVAAVGAQSWGLFGTQEASLAVIMTTITGSTWPAILLAVSAIISIFSCTLVTIFGQTRILFAISRDGLMPRSLQRMDQRGTPVVGTWAVVIGCALLAAFADLSLLADVASMGTLMTYLAGCIAVIVMRRQGLNAPGSFRAPGYPFTPVLGIAACGFLLSQMAFEVWGCTLVVLAVGLSAYLAHFRHTSVLGRMQAELDDLIDESDAHANDSLVREDDSLVRQPA